MKINCISDIPLAIEKGNALKYAYVREYSRVYIGNTPVTLNSEEIIEVRFFEPGREIRIFDNTGCLCAAELLEEDGDCCIEKSHNILFPEKFGEKIITREYLEADGDGQMYIKEICLSEWKGDAQIG